MYLSTFSRAKFFKIQYLDMKSDFCQSNKLQLKYFALARFSNTGPFLGHPVYSSCLVITLFDPGQIRRLYLATDS